MVLRHAPLTLLLIACETDSMARNEDGLSPPSAANTEEDAGVAPANDISIAGTLVEQLVNAPSKDLNETSWQGIANGGYLRFALYGDGLGSISETTSPAMEFSWRPSGNDAVTFTGNPWFGDLTIVGFGDARTLSATSRSGGVFGMRWDLIDTPPGG